VSSASAVRTGQRPRGGRDHRKTWGWDCGGPPESRVGLAVVSLPNLPAARRFAWFRGRRGITAIVRRSSSGNVVAFGLRAPIEGSRATTSLSLWFGNKKFKHPW